MINKHKIGNTKDDNKNNIVIMAIILVTIIRKVKFKINKIVTKQIHFP